MIGCALLEDTVIDGQGQRVGTIEELLIDVDAGSVAYAIIARDAGTRVNVPWSALHFDAHTRQFILQRDDAPTR